MFLRNYKVKGNDVDDFMVMQNSAYLEYSSKIFDTFLFVKGFTKLKMNRLKVGLQNKNDQVIQYQPLLFTQPFSVQIEFKKLLFTNQKMNIEIHFFNKENELCTTINRAFFWFDYTSWQTISPPKTIASFFLKEKEFERKQ